MRRRSAVAWFAAALLLGAAPRVSARSTVVVGALASSAYLYTGQRNQSIFYQGAPHDAQFRGGGLLGVEYTRSWLEARAGLFAGALIATLADGFRMPVAALDSGAQWRAGRRITLNGSLAGSIEPVMSTRQSSTGPATTVGRPSLVFNPELSLEGRASSRDLITVTTRANGLYLLSDHLEVHGEDLAAAIGVEGDLALTHSFRGERALIAHAFSRVMGAKARTNPPVTVLAGGQVGLSYPLRRLRLRAAAGAVKIFRLPNSHLWPVEPALNLELTFQPNQLDRVDVRAVWAVRENVYVGGLPSRTINAAAAWSQTPSHRRLRTTAELSYDMARVGASRLLPSGRVADTLHMIRSRGRLYYTIAGGLRVFAAVEVAVGFTNLAVPDACAPARCADTGFMFQGLAGVAYLFYKRPADERLLTSVW